MKTITRIFKSVSDETRVRILLLLSEYKELCVCDLMSALDLPQSTVSRHLSYLKNSGWLEDRRGGIWMYYSLQLQLSKAHTAILATIINDCCSHKDHQTDQCRLEAHRQNKDC